MNIRFLEPAQAELDEAVEERSSTMTGQQRYEAQAGRRTYNDAVQPEVRLYDRLFTEVHPEADGEDFLENLNANSLSAVTGMKDSFGK